MTGKLIKLTEKDVMLGVMGNTASAGTLNACVLLAKWYIYKCKLSDENLFFYKHDIDITLT